jgi:TRAP-type C4-dicarboxylate transport system substrate-binding protein
MNRVTRTLASGALGLGLVGAGSAEAEDITLRIASGHPPAVVYTGLIQSYFQTELIKRVAERTDHTISVVEGYSGSIVKVNEVFEGVRDGIVDIGGFCFCFEPSNLPLHAFQTMLPFGPADSIDSLRVAQAVYDKVPYLTDVFEEQYNQKLLARITDASYNLGTKLEWDDVSDLKDVKIAGAGLNLNWLKWAGPVPVQFSLPEAYTGLTTGVYDGAIMFPSAWVNLKLYEPAPVYTLIEFGTITWHGLTINTDTWNRLPPEVQEILVEVARDYEEQVGINNRARYEKDVQTLRGLEGVTVNEISPAVRQSWAESLADWPAQHAAELDAQGLPASEVLNLALDAAEAIGHKWPVRYVIPQ